MQNWADKLTESRFSRKADKFCNSVWYIFATGFVCAFCHCLNIPVVGAGLLTMLLLPAFLFCKNMFVLIPFMTMCSFVLSKDTLPDTGYFNNALSIMFLCIFGVINLAAIIFNIVYYERYKTLFKRAYLSLSFCILTVALLLGGVGAPSWSLTGLGMSIVIGVSMFLSYSLILNCGIYEGKKSITYFGICLITAAIVLIVEFFQLYVINGFSTDIATVKTFLLLGCVGPNTGAAIILLSIPITFYFVYEYKHGYLFLFLIIIELLGVAMTYSRASAVVAIPGTLIVATVLCFKKKIGKKQYLIAYFVAVFAAIILIVIFRNKLYDLILMLFSGNSTGSGRTTLWELGFDAWKGYPIAGLGLWYLRISGRFYYSFHCTPLTYLFCFGIIGLAAYIFHRYKTVRLLFSTKLTSERVFVALTVFAMLCNALLDIAMTAATHLIYYGIMLALIELDVNNVQKTSCICDSNVNKRDETNSFCNKV